jgi:hypothetical protein
VKSSLKGKYTVFPLENINLGGTIRSFKIDKNLDTRCVDSNRMPIHDVRGEMGLVFGLVVAERAEELGLLPTLQSQVTAEIVVMLVALPALMTSVFPLCKRKNHSIRTKFHV